MWSITTTGDYTLPIGFGGQFNGHPTFIAGTNRGTTLSWTDESVIRERRANMNQETGTPYMMAVRPMNTGTPRRRYEMMFYRMPSEYPERAVSLHAPLRCVGEPDRHVAPHPSDTTRP
jgi:hypothetical protein